jgi:hypothetical protein
MTLVSVREPVLSVERSAHPDAATDRSAGVAADEGASAGSPEPT